MLPIDTRISEPPPSDPSYAQLDRAELQLANIEQGIEATLDLLALKLGKRVVEVVSELGKGTAFTIRLPREQSLSRLTAW
ncbi:MAG: hypothetical protein ACRD21_22220 [Vicinamibacteria bacterium]